MFTQKKNKSLIVLSTVVLMLLCAVQGCKKEEHPTGSPEEHPTQTDENGQLTKDELADAIVEYVQRTADEQGGYFIVYDDVNDEELKLTLDKVHRKRLARTAENEYFACADFRTPREKVYDLDVFMIGTNKDNLEFSEFSIHKEAGKERYTWRQKNGIWEKVPVNGNEHPEGEHPRKKDHPKGGEHPSEHPK
ncbi:MAG TPA: hypothetical protein ENH94_10450 [Phycisphaerales bacterium]|nr:hypothetical protein [Phycisphaerales bacterium]